MASTGILHYLQTGDLVTYGVAWLLLAMSVASWCFLLAKSWMLSRTRRQAPRALLAFWQSPNLSEGMLAMRAIERQRIFTPLAAAALHAAQTSPIESMIGEVGLDERVLRALRQALHTSQRRLEFGQVLLASIGSTAPFVGLLGTVWGIYHALGNIAAGGQAAIENVAGPVGEALIMTAFGLVVAIPAVLAYNVLGRIARQIGEDLDGFAHDLHVYVGAADTAGTRRSPQIQNHLH